MSEPGSRLERHSTEAWDMSALKQRILEAFERDSKGVAPYEQLPSKVTQKVLCWIGLHF